MAVTLAVISFFVTAVSLVDSTGTCGVVDRNRFEIRAGWTKLYHKLDWIVQIHAEINKSVVKCLGVAITEKWVITAGACVKKASR